jgi:hypothetical protein
LCNGSTALTCVTTVDSAKSVTASFNLKSYTLSMAITGNGVVTPAVGNHIYLYGTDVTLTATPDSGWGFVGWSGDLLSAGRTTPVVITILNDMVITATFSSQPVADAGVSRTVKSNTQVTLDGSGSFGINLPLTYGWQQSGGQPIIMNSTTISQPTFTAPGTVSLTQQLTFTLIVTDDLGFASTPSELSITVVPYQIRLPLVYKN